MMLREIIAGEIRERGPIPFSRYMELCLYHPQYGYYSRPQEKFGKAGDFYTSSDVHAVFGRLLARQFEEMWSALGSPDAIDIIELGPGRGLFAADVLAWSEKKFPEFYAALRYRLVEGSASLRKACEENLHEAIGTGKASVYAGLDDLVEHVASGAPATQPAGRRRYGKATIIFANEFFDALPVERVNGAQQVFVGVSENRFVEGLQPSSPSVLEYLDRYSVHPERDEYLEVPLEAQRWMREAAAVIGRGFVVAIDYGYTREEQLAGRHRDTLMTYREHSAGTDPYEAPGEQDITAHVNFTALRAAGEGAGLETAGLVTQSQFLLGIGEANEFADAFEDTRLPQERAKVALQLKHLITPSGMGETFHVLAMARGVEKEEAARLSGLSFGARFLSG
jgi:SAM-dependent MidA family methyltransferase